MSLEKALRSSNPTELDEKVFLFGKTTELAEDL